MVTVDLQNKSREFQELYARANPLPGARAKVPLLEVTPSDGDAVFVTESLVVAEYVAEKFGSGGGAAALLPESAEDRAASRLFTELCGGAFGYVAVLRAPEGERRDAAVRALREGLAGADAFLQRHGSAPFLLGTRFSLAEANAAPFVQRMCAALPAYGALDPLDLCDEMGLEHLRRWMEAVLARPSVVRTGVPRERLLGNVAAMLERFAAAEASKAG